MKEFSFWTDKDHEEPSSIPGLVGHNIVCFLYLNYIWVFPSNFFELQDYKIKKTEFGRGGKHTLYKSLKQTKMKTKVGMTRCQQNKLKKEGPHHNEAMGGDIGYKWIVS